MKVYHLNWEIEVSAESAEDAARKALQIHRDPDSRATVFQVTNDAGHTQKIDLTEIDEKPTVKSVWGMECPTCKSDRYLRVELNCWSDLTADGTNLDRGGDWGPDSACECLKCCWYGKVEDTYIKETAS